MILWTLLTRCLFGKHEYKTWVSRKLTLDGTMKPYLTQTKVPKCVHCGAMDKNAETWDRLKATPKWREMFSYKFVHHMEEGGGMEQEGHWVERDGEPLSWRAVR